MISSLDTFEKISISPQKKLEMQITSFASLTQATISQEEWKEFFTTSSTSISPMDLDDLREYVRDFCDFITSIDQIRGIVASIIRS